jgi:hypothetical protein
LKIGSSSPSGNGSLKERVVFIKIGNLPFFLWLIVLHFPKYAKKKSGSSFSFLCLPQPITPTNHELCTLLLAHPSAAKPDAVS